MGKMCGCTTVVGDHHVHTVCIAQLCWYWWFRNVIPATRYLYVPFAQGLCCLVVRSIMFAHSHRYMYMPMCIGFETLRDELGVSGFYSRCGHLEFFIDLNPSVALALGSTQPLTEVSTKG
jgi:hypothetical protein